jgi:hypothetical protein
MENKKSRKIPRFFHAQNVLCVNFYAQVVVQIVVQVVALLWQIFLNVYAAITFQVVALLVLL